MEWIWEREPSKPGWYAETHCWDISEGMFCGGNYWDGAAWLHRHPVVCYAGPFSTEEEASAWAYDHDMEL